MAQVELEEGTIVIPRSLRVTRHGSCACPRVVIVDGTVTEWWGQDPQRRHAVALAAARGCVGCDRGLRLEHTKAIARYVWWSIPSGSATMGYYSEQQKCVSVTYGAAFDKSGEARCYAGRDIFLEIHPSFIIPLIPKPRPVASHNYRQKLLWDDFWDIITPPVQPPSRVASNVNPDESSTITDSGLYDQD